MMSSVSTGSRRFVQVFNKLLDIDTVDDSTLLDIFELGRRTAQATHTVTVKYFHRSRKLPHYFPDRHLFCDLHISDPHPHHVSAAAGI